MNDQAVLVVASLGRHPQRVEHFLPRTLGLDDERVDWMTTSGLRCCSKVASSSTQAHGRQALSARSQAEPVRTTPPMSVEKIQRAGGGTATSACSSLRARPSPPSPSRPAIVRRWRSAPRPTSSMNTTARTAGPRRSSSARRRHPRVSVLCPPQIAPEDRDAGNAWYHRWAIQDSNLGPLPYQSTRSLKRAIANDH
jgi:hypothetical protein